MGRGRTFFLGAVMVTCARVSFPCCFRPQSDSPLSFLVQDLSAEGLAEWIVVWFESGSDLYTL